jgi:hypothetical protein
MRRGSRRGAIQEWLTEHHENKLPIKVVSEARVFNRKKLWRDYESRMQEGVLMLAGAKRCFGDGCKGGGS